MDGVRDELVSEKVMSAGLKSELETAELKVQTIAVNAMSTRGLNSWVNLREVSILIGIQIRRSRCETRGQPCWLVVRYREMRRKMRCRLRLRGVGSG